MVAAAAVAVVGLGALGFAVLRGDDGGGAGAGEVAVVEPVDGRAVERWTQDGPGFDVATSADRGWS